MLLMLLLPYPPKVQNAGEALVSVLVLKYLSGSSIVIVAQSKNKVGGPLTWEGEEERLFAFRRSVCPEFFFAQDAVKNL